MPPLFLFGPVFASLSPMDIFLQQLINGLTLGSVYAVVALGYTMVYGIIQLINFAHGEVVMIGAMVAFTVIGLLAPSGLPPLVVVLIGVACAVPVCMLIGYTMERLAYRPLRRAPRLAPLITAIGVSIILQHLALLVWSRNNLAFPQILTTVSYPHRRRHDHQRADRDHADVAGDDGRPRPARVPHAARHRDARNRAERAGRGPDGHRHQPHDLRHLRDRRGAGRGRRRDGRQLLRDCALQMGALLGLKAFSAAVLGGIGNLPGAMLGGILLGVVEALGAGYIGDLTNNVFGSNYQDVFAFIVLILVLVFRPSGLLGEQVGDRA